MSSVHEPEVGQVVADKYRLTKLLGRGGMGSVWEGVHTSLGTRVAVKFIEAAFAKQPEVRDRFMNEAHAAARLQSKHIVQVFDHGVTAEGRPYIVMEYLSGEPLDARLAREGTLSLGDTATILLQLCRAMQRAHSAGIVHRDLKPENVFLVWDEEDQRDIVKVVDFGIAKFTGESGISSSTRTGTVLGTPHFMSPEQARGLKDVDARSDVWSIGVIAYRCVTGGLPFDGEAVGDLLVKICTQQPSPASESVPLPRAFDEWLATSLAKEPQDRFPSTREQAAALRALVDAAGVQTAGNAGLPVQVNETSPTQLDTAAGVTAAAIAGLPSSPRSARLITLVAIAAVALIGMALTLNWLGTGADSSDAVAGADPTAAATSASHPSDVANAGDAAEGASDAPVVTPALGAASAGGQQSASGPSREGDEATAGPGAPVDLVATEPAATSSPPPPTRPGKPRVSVPRVAKPPPSPAERPKKVQEDELGY